MKKLRNLLSNVTLTLIGLTIGLIFAEILLRQVSPHDQFYSLPPNVNVQGKFGATDLFPGMNEQFTFTTNEYGYRSKHLFEKNRFGILALGGSTTECTYVGDDNIWTNLLEKKLNSLSNQSITVGNMGVSALNANHHWLQLKYQSHNFENIDAIMMLVGVNDFMRALYPPSYYPDSSAQARRAFSKFPRDFNEQWHKKTEIWMHLRDIKNSWKNGRLGWKEGYREEVARRRMAIKKSRVIHKNPDLSADLDRYEKVIDDIYQYCRNRSLKLILITQPLLWREGMTQHEFELSSVGAYIMGDSTYAPKVYEKGIKSYNDILRKYASKQDVTLVDLASSLPKDTTVFYDFCHYNINGNNVVADIIFNDLKSLFTKKSESKND